jgi:hypothetical protein
MTSYIIYRRTILFLFVALLLALPLTEAVAVNMEITNVNSDNFPGIHVFVRATDDQGNYLPDLGNTNFELRENGVVVSFSLVAQFGYMAVSLVMDESGSMSGYEQEVIEACNYFVNGMDDLDKGALVMFATQASLTLPMTYDKTQLLDSIATYTPNGYTDLWDAINLGIQECYYEPEKSAVVTFTDGNNNQPGVYAAQLPELAGTDITLYNIGIGNIDPDSLIYVAEQTGGFYLQIEDPTQMQSVLVDIREDIGNLYDIYYTSPNPTPDGTVRALQLILEYESESLWDTISYVAPNVPPPQMALESSTSIMFGVSQPAGSPLMVSCQVASLNTIVDARIYYKTVGSTYFSQADLNYTPPRTYWYNIPGSFVQSPGVEFYFQVTNDEGATVTLPAFNPGYLPYSIPVLPNYAPEITYEPPENWLTRKSLPIEITADDLSGSVAEVNLYYRAENSFFYNEMPMVATGGDAYECTIEGPEINLHDDLEIFIAAWDNLGMVNYWQLSDDPYYLLVIDEPSPTPPAVVLESEPQPIVIPATGGSFFYTMYAINPIPNFTQCDVWADLILPDGSSQVLDTLLSYEAFAGGETIQQTNIQEVPDTAQAGEYSFRVHTGDFATLDSYYMASFPFSKSATMMGPEVFRNGWAWYPLDPQPPEAGNPVVMFQADYPGLGRGYPNPFNAATTIQYYLPENAFVTLIIHDLAGREVVRLADGFKSAGVHIAEWDATRVSSGMYFCSLKTGNVVLTTKLTLVK